MLNNWAKIPAVSFLVVFPDGRCLRPDFSVEIASCMPVDQIGSSFLMPHESVSDRVEQGLAQSRLL
jgi:hypothetical protein